MSVYVMFVCLINTEFQKYKAGFSNKNFEDITLKYGGGEGAGGGGDLSSRRPSILSWNY